MTRSEAVILSDLRRAFSELYGDRLAKMVLFGSRARGDSKPDSDYDVLVVLRGSVDPNIEIFRTSLTYDVLITCVHVSLADFEQSGSSLLRNVQREGVAV